MIDIIFVSKLIEHLKQHGRDSRFSGIDYLIQTEYTHTIL